VQSVEELVEFGIGVGHKVVRRTSGLVVDVFLMLLSDRAELPVDIVLRDRERKRAKSFRCRLERARSIAVISLLSYIDIA
jgi:hypothetical protein